MEFSCVGGAPPKRCSLGLTALLHSEIIMGCQNSFIYLLRPLVSARKTKTTCSTWWERLLCDFSARKATWSRFQHPPIVTAALSHIVHTELGVNQTGPPS